MKAEKKRLVGVGAASERSEGERSEPERSAEAGPTATTIRAFGAGPGGRPDPEVSEKSRRRRFSAAFKLRILEEVDACRQPGEIGALLRREGLYWSNLQTWRRQRDEGALVGLAPRKRGRKATEKNPLRGRVQELEREIRRLQRKLGRAEIMLDIQKKVSELLGIPLTRLESTNEEDE